MSKDNIENKNREVNYLLAEIKSLKSSVDIEEVSKKNLIKLEKMLGRITTEAVSGLDFETSLNLIKAEILKEQVQIEYYIDKNTEAFSLLIDVINLNCSFLRKKISTSVTREKIKEYNLKYKFLLNSNKLSSEAVYLIDIAFAMLDENMEEFK